MRQRGIKPAAKLNELKQNYDDRLGGGVTASCFKRERSGQILATACGDQSGESG